MGLALFGEDLTDSSPGPRFEQVIGINERPAQPGREQRTDGRFAATTITNEKEVHGWAL